MKRYPRVPLYHDDNPYETVDVYLELREDEMRLYARTSEKAPGDSYGTMYLLDRENSEKLLNSPPGDPANSTRKLILAFYGEDAVKAFQEHCDKNAIRYSVSLTS